MKLSDIQVGDKLSFDICLDYKYTVEEGDDFEETHNNDLTGKSYEGMAYVSYNDIIKVEREGKVIYERDE